MKLENSMTATDAVPEAPITKKRGRPKKNISETPLPVEVKVEVKKEERVPRIEIIKKMPAPVVSNDTDLETIVSSVKEEKAPTIPKNAVYLSKAIKQTNPNHNRISQIISDFNDDKETSKLNIEFISKKIKEFFKSNIIKMEKELHSENITNDRVRMLNVLIEFCNDGIISGKFDPSITPLILFYNICLIPGISLEMDYTGITRIEASNTVSKESLVSLKIMYLTIHDDPNFCRHILLGLFNLN